MKPIKRPCGGCFPPDPSCFEVDLKRASQWVLRNVMVLVCFSDLVMHEYSFMISDDLW